jgi:exopolyphosphatase / guanosine-5'-triphosphate,3'-diphosphate pyrophosphatase
MAVSLPSTRTENPSSPRLGAVIDIGASSIRMAIAEIHDDGRVRTLETFIQACGLGKDSFGPQRRIRRPTIEDCVRIMKGYRRVLEEYGIQGSGQVRVVATSAVREAVNRLSFLDRVYIATGLEIEPIDEAEVNRITYMGVLPHLQQDSDLFNAKTIVIEVGGGSTELLLVRGDNVLRSDTYRLGSLRLAEALSNWGAPAAKRRQLMESQIQRTIGRIRSQVRADMKVEMIALGGDIRFAAKSILTQWDPEELAQVPVEALETLARQCVMRTDDELVQEFGVNYVEASTLGPALLTYAMVARGYELQRIHVSSTNLRDGLLHEMAARERWTSEFRDQIVRSAIILGRKFDFDEAYARHVALLAKKLFEQLAADHRLESKYETVLYVASLLHEIGLYVNIRSNHKHAMYVIRNSELFGLSRQEVLLVSLVARYHRRASPQPTHEGYGTLDRAGRVAVSKMAAILRLAIALNDSRSGRIKEIRCHRQRDQLVIELPGLEDVSIEQLALRQSGGLFTEVFGVPVLLRVGRQ